MKVFVIVKATKGSEAGEMPSTELLTAMGEYNQQLVSALQEAIDWVKKCPNPMLEDSDIEIRPYMEVEDFGEAFTPELQEQEAALRATGLGLNSPTFQVCPDLEIAGLNQSYTTETRIGIPQQWARFVPRAGSIPGMKSPVCFGVCWNTKTDTPSLHITVTSQRSRRRSTRSGPDGRLTAV